MGLTRQLLFLVLIITSAIGLLNAQLSALYPDVIVLSSDERGITIEFKPHFLPDEKISFEGNEFTLPNFEHAYSSLSSEAGREDIRARVLTAALPGYIGNSISILASDYETMTNFSLAPVPEIQVSGKLGTVSNSYKPQFSAGQDFYPQSIAALENIAWVKGIVTGNIVVTPFQYQASTKTLRKYSRIVIRVEYGLKENVFGNSQHDEWARALLINYPTAKRWMAQQAFRKTAATNSLLSSGTWFKVEVMDDGIYKIDASYLRSLGVDPSSLSSITDVKVFGADGKRIAGNPLAPRPADLLQVAVYYADQNGNSKFDDDDYILFYGQGVTGWNYSSKKYSHYTNPYTNSNYYFISIGVNAPVMRMQEVTLSDVSSQKVTKTTGKVFFDEEKFNFNSSGQNWVSAPFNPGESRVISNKLNGWIPGTPVSYSVYLYSRANVPASFPVEESGVQIGVASIPQMSDEALDDPQALYANSRYAPYVVTPNLTDSRSNLKFTYNANGSVATGFIDWIEILYQRQLTAVNNEIVFDSPDSSGLIVYQIDGFSSNADVFDVSNVNSVKKVGHSSSDVGTILFSDSLSATGLKKYWAGTSAAYRYPKSFVKLPNSNLRSYSGAEFIIVTHNEFKSAALRFKSYKESLPKPISTVVVDVDTIYNEFGVGMPDPFAIRDFLKYAAENWNVKPGYVLFFGDASYDFKSILGNDKSWVPTFQTLESNDKINSYSTEDSLTYFNNSASVAIASGRLVPRSASEADFLIDRIINYETEQYKGPWKNTVTIVGDDVWTPTSSSETIHTRQAESLATTYVPKSYEVKKIYLGEYATVFTSTGRRKPDARLAIINQVNNGTLLMNYTGHGNPKVWAHENVLTIDDVRTQFTNNDRLAFFVAATCDWGRFEEAGEQSSAEEAMVNRQGGAIGVFSATRAVYSSFNFSINIMLYQMLFSPPNMLRLGDVVMLAKNRESSDLINKQKYFLLGDPTLTLAVPRMKLSVDSINGRSTATVDTLRSLEKVTIKATARDTSGIFAPDYSGTALVTVYDADKLLPFTEMSGSYPVNGAVIYRGENSITNGQLSASFIVPKDISYLNKNGRISVYFSNESTDGRGYTTNFILGGTNEQAQSDSAGPAITIYFNTASFRPGDVVTENSTLIVELADVNGINTSNSAIGHRIEAWIDDSPKSIDLTDYYKGKIDNYQAGTVEYKLSNQTIGRHSIKVRAWDAYNNSSIAESYFSVASGEGLSIHNVYNFPNPVSTATSFTFQVNQSTPIDVTINLYSVAGRLIHTIQRGGESGPFISIPWDRRDRDGDEVGNGIYFYKVVAKTIDGKYSSEAIGKLAVVR